jgi:hypothetical protein
MADSGLAYDPDRLPWLTEERKPRRKAGRTPWMLWALIAALVLAAGSYWLGMQTATQSDDFTAPSRNSPGATVTLPRATIVEPQVRPSPMPNVQPVAEPAPIRLSQGAPARRATIHRRLPNRPQAQTVSNLAQIRAEQAEQAKPVEPIVTVIRPAPLKPWPAAVSEGAYGRVVRIGTFSTRHSAKVAWWKLVQHYPGMKKLKAVVAPVQSLRNGKIYYRLQFGTTSQAHSEVLCQRMRFIAQSCVVVGLPKR